MENLILWYTGNEKEILLALNGTKNGYYRNDISKKLLNKDMKEKLNLYTLIDFVRIVDTMYKIEKLTNEKAKFFFGNMPNEHYIGLDILPNKLNREWLNDIYSIIDNNLPCKLITFGMVGTSFPKAEPIKK